MNKYLTKIAAKYELEPGVMYNDEDHKLSVSREKALEMDKDYKQLSSRVIGGVYSAFGGAMGGGIGKNLPKPNNLKVLGLGAGGALLLGGIGYGIGNLAARDKSNLAANRHLQIGKLEDKHKEQIYKIHGWNK